MKLNGSFLVKTIAIIFGVVLLLSISIQGLTSCTEKKQIATDGYHFEQESFVNKSFWVNVVLVEDEWDLLKLSNVAGIRFDPTTKMIKAFSVVQPNKNLCTVYIVDPRVRYEPEFIGHEFTHCLMGDWHGKQF